MKQPALFLSLLFLFGCTSADVETTQPEQAENPPVETEQPVDTVPEEPEPVVTTTSIYAIGDVLLHDSVYDAAKSGDGYDFTPAFEKVASAMSKADITIANQESMIGGSDIGLSSYPAFNSPYEIGDALQEAGIDLVTTANNHTLDRGVKAIENSIAYWNSIDMPYTGSFLSEEDKANVRTLTANDISFAFLAYTYGTNGVVPKQPYHVNYIDVEAMKRDIEAAEQIAELTVVALHFGNEYEPLPNESQQTLVQQLSDFGVDIIIGHHPHVLQPTAWVDGAEGNRTFVAYSLGNFLSGQQGDERNTGGIVGIDIVKTTIDGESTFELTNPMFYPTFTRQSSAGHFEVVPLQSAKPELFNETSEHMKQWMPELEIIQ
ncbi:CapA family protein [Exiguobacterium sp. SH0S7]|uniref:CapA family protein n=1 Tax=Exiguobacterium sp. SH0S7 TaxID=2510951 RepID=UPI00103F43C1|nr:CapA family protein [Exiguobacterium sp. SH0S7]TCI73520.1 CapA family protein [Exiguobacterium sp. SH0S7]